MIMNETTDMCLDLARAFREAKGVLVNTLVDLKPAPIKYLSDPEMPPVYSIGSIMRSKRIEGNSTSSNSSRDLSVLFLCFGSMGSFDEDQVKGISVALKNTSYCFLWPLKPPPNNIVNIPDDYPSFDRILPERFLDWTDGIRRVIGWALQAEKLSHPSGGFSHCGWNSILENVCFGAPIVTWSMHSEQQLNAFLIVRELGLGIKISMDYNVDFDTTLIGAVEIGKGIREVMKQDSETSKIVKEMSECGKKALQEHGSSYMSLCIFIHDVLDVPPC